MLFFTFCEKEIKASNRLRNLSCHYITTNKSVNKILNTFTKKKPNYVLSMLRNIFWSSDLRNSPSNLSLKQKIRQQWKLITGNYQKAGSSRNNEKEPEVLDDEPTG